MSAESPAPSLEMAVEAIRTLYHNPDTHEKEKASNWLQNLQQSVHAWKVSDELLHRKLSVESCYFAAQTMRTKIQHNFAELPTEAHVSLRESLLEHVNSINDDTDHVIVIQLSVALADLVLQMHEWKNSLVELMQRFATSRPVALLEILVVLPEEVNCRHLRLGANRREEVITEIRQSAPMVMAFLEACLTMKVKNEVHFRTNLFRCLMSWITLGALPLNSILQGNTVVSYAFQVLENINEPANVHEAAADAICSLLERLEELDEMQQQQPEVASALELNLFTVIRRLEQSYHLAVAHEDIFKAVNFCRVFTEFGESMLTSIVSLTTPTSQHFAVAILDCVLICCGHPDYEVPDITFNLWYRLSEEIYHRNDEQVTAIFRPYIERLISALCRHCQMEPDSDGILEEGEDFTEFRLRVIELIKDVVFIVGSSNIFRRMYEYLMGVSNWETMEAALFVMSAVAHNTNPADNENVPQVLESILAVPETAHIAVRHTSLKLVGELGDWIDKHPQYLERILNWLLIGLRNPKLSSESASALQNMCSLCRKHMGPHFDGLITILQSLNTFHLKPMAANGLIKGVAIIMTNMPHDQISAAMRTLCWLQVNPLNAILEVAQEASTNGQGVVAAPRNSDMDPSVYLDRLAAVFRHVTPEIAENSIHPCQAVITEIWPVLSRTFSTFQSDVRVMERCCRTVRFAIRCVGMQSAPLLEPLVKQMVALYQSHPHSCFLYLGSILVDEFSHLPGCVPGLLSMVDTFLPVTFQLLRAENGLRNHPDTVDDFFRLNARCLQRAAVPYLQAPFLTSIMECGLLCVSLDHREANASVMKYFFDLLHCGRSKEDREDFASRAAIVVRLKDEFGPRLVENVVRASVFQLPSYTFHDIGDVFYELMLYDRAIMCKWLEEALKGLPVQGANGLVIVTRKQLVQFHKSVTTAEEPKAVAEAVRQFTRLWR